MSAIIAKSLTPVAVVMSSGHEYEGGLYIAAGERLQDMLNSNTAFVPFRFGEALMMLAKSQIVSVEILPG